MKWKHKYSLAQDSCVTGWPYQKIYWHELYTTDTYF